MLPITSKQVVNLFVAKKCIGAIGNNGAGFIRCVNRHGRSSRLGRAAIGGGITVKESRIIVPTRAKVSVQDGSPAGAIDSQHTARRNVAMGAQPRVKCVSRIDGSADNVS